MSKVSILILISIIFFSASCIVSFENPISTEQTKEIDKRLLGKWHDKIEEDITFEISNDINSQTILTVFNEDEKAEKLFSVTATQVGKYYYLNLQLLNKAQDETFLLVKYELNGDELKTWMLDKSKFTDLIEDGKLTGNKLSNGEILVSNSTNELNKILESPESEKLFKIFATFKKE